MANEAAKLVGDDVATAEAIDTGMQLGAGFPEGTYRRADDIDLDTILEKLRALSDEHVTTATSRPTTSSNSSRPTTPARKRAELHRRTTPATVPHRRL